MWKTITQCLCALLCTAGLGSQSFRDGFDASQSKIEDEEWKEALELLLLLTAKTELEEELKPLATSLYRVGTMLQGRGDFEDALRAFTAYLALQTRRHGGRDHADVALSLNKVAECLQFLGRRQEALLHCEATLAMLKRLVGDRDDRDVATNENNVGFALLALGRGEEALPRYEAAYAMRKRLHGDSDNADVAQSLNNIAFCLQSLGRWSEALPRFEAAIAMRRRIHADGDDPQLARSLHNLGFLLRSLGRADEALPWLEAALAMRERLHGGRAHADVAATLSTTAVCLQSLGEARGALPRIEAALAMFRRLHGDRDHEDVAKCLNNLGLCLLALDRPGDALPQFAAGLAMRRRLDDAHHRAEIAVSLDSVGACLVRLGRFEEGLSECAAALAMRKQILGEADHDVMATSLNNMGSCLARLGRVEEAIPQLEAAAKMWKRLYGERDHADLAQCQTSIAHCLHLLGRTPEAFDAAAIAVRTVEGLRGGTRIADELRQSLFDELKRGGAFELLQRVASELGRPEAALHAAERSRGRDLMDKMSRLGDLDGEALRRARSRGDTEAADRLTVLHSDIESARIESDRLLHRLTTLSATTDHSTHEQRRDDLLRQSDAVATKLRQLRGERAKLVGDVLPIGRVGTISEIRDGLLKDELLLEFTLTSELALLYVLARDGEVEVMELPNAFATVQRVLPPLLQSSSRSQVRGRDVDEKGPDANVSVAARRELFASLIPAAVWQRMRTARRVFIAAHRDLHRLPFEMLATDSKGDEPVLWIDDGPPIGYVASGTMLHWMRKRALSTSKQTKTIETLVVGDPKLGDADPRALSHGVEPARFVHRDDLERLSKLPQLQGARAEAMAIAAAFRAKDARVELLLDEKAIEPTVFESAAKAKYLHFACHGIAEEYAGRSLSMLVLAQRSEVRPGDDGFLKLDDLFYTWSGRLDGCRLVTLSACRTNVGDTGRDEAPQALPMGFLFAGAAAVISSLWAVDDVSTEKLMTDFYSRLLDGEVDTLAAFTAAKKALRAKYPDPFYWAPFLYIGAPE